MRLGSVLNGLNVVAGGSLEQYSSWCLDRWLLAAEDRTQVSCKISSFWWHTAGRPATSIQQLSDRHGAMIIKQGAAFVSGMLH